MRRPILGIYDFSLLLIVILISLFPMIPSCSGGGGGGDNSYTDTIPPQMFAQWPDDGASWIAPTTKITALIYDNNYSGGSQGPPQDSLDYASVNTATFLVYDDAGNYAPGQIKVERFWQDWYFIQGHFIVSNKYLASFTPTKPLKTDTKFNVKLTTGIQDQHGNHPANEISWIFTSGPQGVGKWTRMPENRIHPYTYTGCAFWTGSEIIVWSYNNMGGFLYDPLSATWREMSTANGPPAWHDHSCVWTGKELIIWGQSARGTYFPNSGARYDPAMDLWTSMSTEGQPGKSDMTNYIALWTGTEMIIWGSDRNGNKAGGRYNPTTDSWTPISTVNAPSYKEQIAVWTGTELIIWSPGGAGGRYNPETDSWATVSTLNEPPCEPIAPDAASAAGAAGIWTGTEMITWGGTFCHTGGRYDPKTDTWKTISLNNAPPPTIDPLVFWTGSQMLVWGGYGSNNGYYVYTSYGGIYDPITDTWSITSAIDAPGFGTGVWTGTEMIVWMVTSDGVRDGWVFTPPPQ